MRKLEGRPESRREIACAIAHPLALQCVYVLGKEPDRRLLNFAQLLRDPHAQQNEDKDSGSHAEDPDWNS